MTEHEPLDNLDAAVLEELRATYEDVDPVPADLVERIKFSLALDEMFEEVARMTRVPLEEMSVRGDPNAGTRTETLTFSAERLTAMVTVSRPGPGRLRLDGWLAPSATCRVRLRIQGAASRETICDDAGRFSFEDLEEGFAQLSFHPLGKQPSAASGESGAASGGEDRQNVVVTPVFQL